MIRLDYQIPVNPHFYVYKPPRPLDQNETGITKLERAIAGLLAGMVA